MEFHSKVLDLNLSCHHLVRKFGFNQALGDSVLWMESTLGGICSWCILYSVLIHRY